MSIPLYMQQAVAFIIFSLASDKVKKHENECPRLNDQICTCKHIPGCGVETHKTPEIQTDLTLHPVQGPQQFRTLLVSNDTLIKQCDTCNTNTEHKTTTRREFPPQCTTL